MTSTTGNRRQEVTTGASVLAGTACRGASSLLSVTSVPYHVQCQLRAGDCVQGSVLRCAQAYGTLGVECECPVRLIIMCGVNCKC